MHGLGGIVKNRHSCKTVPMRELAVTGISCFEMVLVCWLSNPSLFVICLHVQRLRVKTELESNVAAAAERDRTAAAERERTATAERERVAAATAEQERAGAATKEREHAATKERERAATAERERAATVERDRAATAQRERAAESMRMGESERNSSAQAGVDLTGNPFKFRNSKTAAEIGLFVPGLTEKQKTMLAEHRTLTSKVEQLKSDEAVQRQGWTTCRGQLKRAQETTTSQRETIRALEHAPKRKSATYFEGLLRDWYDKKNPKRKAYVAVEEHKSLRERLKFIETEHDKLVAEVKKQDRAEKQLKNEISDLEDELVMKNTSVSRLKKRLVTQAQEADTAEPPKRHKRNPVPEPLPLPVPSQIVRVQQGSNNASAESQVQASYLARV